MSNALRPAFSKVLVVDDEENIRTTLGMYLESLGCKVVAVATEDAALSAAAQDTFDLAFVDLRLQSTSGVDLVPKLLHHNPNTSVVIITAYGSIATAVEALRRGAVDYLAKPFTPEQIAHLVSQLGQRVATQSRVVTLESALNPRSRTCGPMRSAQRPRGCRVA